jgi:hypothetical protein
MLFGSDCFCVDKNSKIAVATPAYGLNTPPGFISTKIFMRLRRAKQHLIRNDYRRSSPSLQQPQQQRFEYTANTF